MVKRLYTLQLLEMLRFTMAGVECRVFLSSGASFLKTLKTFGTLRTLMTLGSSGKRNVLRWATQHVKFANAPAYVLGL